MPGGKRERMRRFGVRRVRSLARTVAPVVLGERARGEHAFQGRTESGTVERGPHVPDGGCAGAVIQRHQQRRPYPGRGHESVALPGVVTAHGLQ